MPRTRKTYPPSLKAKVAVEAIRGVRTAAEIAKAYDVHANLVAVWKKQALEQLPSIFAGAGAGRPDSDPEKDALYQEIGKLKVELDFLKKRMAWHAFQLLLPAAAGERRESGAVAAPGRAVSGAPVPGEPAAGRVVRGEPQARRAADADCRHRGAVSQAAAQPAGPGPGDPSIPAAGPGHRAPNQVWSSDITYVPMRRGFLYLAAVMDWFSRYVLSWALSATLEARFCREALEAALRLGRPDIFNSDQGAQFTTATLQQHQIQISMDGRSRWLDNVFIERLWRSVKYELIYPGDFADGRQLWTALDGYFRFYNHSRPHQALAYRTPAEVFGLPAAPVVKV
jgi:putative transposase